MVNHEAYQTAARALLETLAVCTTGSATLSATTTGYARTAGSFITDGFAVGMEVTPSGFTTNPVATITAVSALTLTTAARPAQSAGSGRTLAVRLPAGRAYENIAYTPVQGVPWVDEQYSGGPAAQTTIGPLGRIDCFPQYHVHVHVPAGAGITAASRYADAILALYAPRTSLPISSGTLVVRSDAAPFRGQILPSRPGFVVVPVNVPLRAFTQNSI